MAATTPRLYLIPGMGADGRLFEGLRRTGLAFEVLEFIPAQEGESLRDYALRLGRGIDATQPFVVGGVSLGGIVAGEIALAMGAQQVILISSVKDSGELPFYFKLGRWLPVHKLFSGGFLKRHGPRASHRGLEPWQSKILSDLRTDADDAFISWATDAVVRWRRAERVAQTLHIHGTHDLMFPGVFLGERLRVSGGRHVMVVTHAQEIAGEIERFLGENLMVPPSPIAQKPF
jgi:pimeloyl-ACP methyl ester carboxylesterase